MSRKVIELPDLYPGWCSSCNILYSTAVKDSDGRYCCERCGDYLLFDSEELIERIAALTEQLHKCAVAARSCEEAVAIGEPFGDEVKAVLTLRQNADAGFAELAQARAENEQLTKWGEGGQKGCIEEQASNARLARERDALRAQLEQMSRPVTDGEWAESHWTEDGGMRGFVDSFIAARARRQENAQ